MIHVRNIHPIGQGAFYTEQFLDDRQGKILANVVYDCGSGTRASLPNFVKEQVVHYAQELKEKNSEIDILFISHFHADHINGIATLKDNVNIKCVVLPLLDPDDKILALIEIHSSSVKREDKEQMIQLINNPEEFFGSEVRIIFIDSNGGKEFNSEHVKDKKSKKAENIFLEEKEDSICLTIMPESNIEWIYIPINYKDTERWWAFEEEMEKSGITMPSNKLDIFDSSQKDLFKSIRKVFNKIKGTINENSMMIYSGLRYEYNEVVKISDFCLGNSCILYGEDRVHPVAGCLYTGDVSMNQDLVDGYINRKLGDYKKCVFIIQIPHHGAESSFSEHIYNINEDCKYFFSSSGVHNKYHHPSKRALYSLRDKRKYYFCVTEISTTKLVEYIKIKKYS